MVILFLTTKFYYTLSIQYCTFCCFLSLYLISLEFYPQTDQNLGDDSLSIYTTKTISRKYLKAAQKNDLDLAKVYIEEYLNRAKKEKNYTNLATGYRSIYSLITDNFERKIAYLDSSIYYGKISDEKKYPTVMYTLKGLDYVERGLFDQALDNYIEALHWSKRRQDTVYVQIINHNIALAKRRLGKYDDAIHLLKNTLHYEKNRLLKENIDSIGYLTTMSELVYTYWQNDDLKKAEALNQVGLTQSGNKNIQHLFDLNQGFIERSKANYRRAISKISKAVPSLLNSEDSYLIENEYVIDAYIVLGESYKALKDSFNSLYYYKKVDSLISKTNYLTRNVREAYIPIIEYYEEENSIKEQLFYTQRLLYVDSILDSRFQSLRDTIYKKYDTPLLLENKEQLISQLQKRKNNSYWITIISLLVVFVVIILLILQRKRHKKFKARFNKLIEQQTQKTEDIPLQKERSRATLHIDEQIVSDIENGITQFELNKGFLKRDIKSSILAEELNTNSKYLTMVIKSQTGKNFVQYINDLRIEYIIYKIQNSPKLQNYTVRALAREAGFNSPEVFSKTFYKTKGIYPSYFIKQIKNIST